MNGNKIIVHTLIKTNNGYLVTKRSKEEEHSEYRFIKSLKDLES